MIVSQETVEFYMSFHVDDIVLLCFGDVMSTFLNSLGVDSFRGIRALELNDLNQINLLVGDNNSGKTSVLEAILLLRAPADEVNLVRVARLRDENSDGESDYERLLNMISRKTNRLSVHALSEGKKYFCELEGRGVCVIRDRNMTPMYKAGSFHNGVATRGFTDEEINAFSGRLVYGSPDEEGEKNVLWDEYVSFAGREIGNKDVMKIVYQASYAYLQNDVVSRIVCDRQYKDGCLDLIRLFDNEIDDILIIKNNQTGMPVECIQHKEYGVMPISSYGDGIKKVLAIASGVYRAKDGILLIDEIESGIHARRYADVFRFLTKACKKNQVQLFITTHSIEAVDGLLEAQKYQKNDPEELLNIITIRNGKERTFCRTLPGFQVMKNREAFGFEVRI